MKRFCKYAPRRGARPGVAELVALGDPSLLALEAQADARGHRVDARDAAIVPTTIGDLLRSFGRGLGLTMSAPFFHKKKERTQAASSSSSLSLTPRPLESSRSSSEKRESTTKQPHSLTERTRDAPCSQATPRCRARRWQPTTPRSDDEKLFYDINSIEVKRLLPSKNTGTYDQ